MVTQNYLDDQEEHFFHRRHNSRSHGYSFNHDRDLSSASSHGVFPGSRNQRFSQQENRDHSLENDSSSRPRSRIPVACGRCRKRKIRCSGDNGGPCTNCKSAGHEQCQFLRVSSTETAMKCDIPTYEYDAPARLICHNIPYGPQAYRQPNSLPLDSYPYRNNSVSSYQYSKPMYSHYSGSFGEENIDYGLESNLIPFDNMGLVTSYTTSNVRGWTPTPVSMPATQITKNPIYLEQPDGTYNHAPSQFQGNGYRLNFAPEKLLPLSSMPAAPPTLLATASVDRVLPMPSANRPSAIPSFLQAADGLPYNASGGMFGSTTDLSLNRVIKSNNNGSVSENTVTENLPLADPYGSLPNNARENTSASHMGYDTHTLNYDHQQNDINYTVRNETRPYEQGMPDSAFHRVSISTRSQRGSHESLATHSESQERSITSPSTSGLPNMMTERPYYPYVSPTASYPPPPVHLQPQHSSPIIQQRPDMNGIPAA